MGSIVSAAARAWPRAETSRSTVAAWLWADFPLLNFALYAAFIAHAELNNLSPPRPDLALSFLFPLSVPILVYAVLWSTLASKRRRAGVLMIVGALVFIGLSYVNPMPLPISRGTLRDLYEISTIINAVLIGVHAWSFGGPSRLALFAGPVALYGMALENGGIWLGYFSELEYRWYLGPLPAPIATMVGWIVVFYLVTHVVWLLQQRWSLLRRSVLASALAATAAALLLDLQIDPLATEVGFWRWHETLPAGPMGVPLLNFVAWGCAVLPFSWAAFWYGSKHRLAPGDIAAPAHRRWLWRQVPWVLVAAAVLFVTSMALVEGGFAGPTFAILRSAAARVTLAQEHWLQLLGV